MEAHGFAAAAFGKQYAELEKAGQLAELKSPQRVRVKNGRLDLHFELPRQAVSLLVLEWK